MWKKAPKNKGAKGSVVTGSKRVPVKDDTPTLADLGLNKKTSSIAQKLAELPPEQFEQVKAGTASVAQAIREVNVANRKPAPPPPVGKFSIVLTDPPWKYDFAEKG